MPCLRLRRHSAAAAAGLLTHGAGPCPPQDGTITRKNSPARNVHRLLNTLNFIAAIFENLAKGQALKVRWVLARRRWAAGGARQGGLSC